MLPEIYAVKNDDSPEFEEFLEWLNKESGDMWAGSGYYFGPGRLGESGVNNRKKSFCWGKEPQTIPVYLPKEWKELFNNKELVYNIF